MEVERSVGYFAVSVRVEGDACKKVQAYELSHIFLGH